MLHLLRMALSLLRLVCRNLVGAGVAALALAVTGCNTVPVTGRQQFNIMPPGEEMQLGISEFGKMKTSVPINHDPKLNALVQRVGRRIAAVAASDMPNAQWEFVVFESGEANAFCLPGGKVGIYTGILPITRDENGLATVMGHEVAHAVARHGGERMSQANAINMVGTGLGAAVDGSKYGALATTAYGLGTQLGIALPHSRQQESEADEIGIIYMARAGFPPVSAVEFWQRFAQFNLQQGKTTLWFLRTHPLDDQRIADLQKLLPKAQVQFKPQ